MKYQYEPAILCFWFPIALTCGKFAIATAFATPLLATTPFSISSFTLSFKSNNILFPWALVLIEFEPLILNFIPFDLFKF
ncbi:hypothetical protein [Streptobacillus ratti]|uniref:hypothetical protein n=1 Tax=Streptobacillus ratti TaxID=1720557 RepID=UPI000932AA81|nr:hypothetical protein [Streptobacillus ratti]